MTTESLSMEPGEVRIERSQKRYWNTKTGGYANKGDQVKGVYLRVELDEFKGKPTTNYIIKDEKGNEITLPNHAVLNGLMSRVIVGSTVRVVYLGKSDAASKRGRSAPELYDVFMSSVPAQAVPAQPAAVTEAVAMDEYMKKIMDDLRFAGQYFPDGIIPEATVMQAITKGLLGARNNDAEAVKRVFAVIKDRGLIFFIENTQGKGFRVSV